MAVEQRSARSVIRQTVKRAQTLTSAGLDRLLGLETTPRPDDPDSPPTGVGYRPFGWFRTLRMLSHYPLREADVFVDIGSGAGRVVLLAGLRYRCRRVVGLERDEKYDDIARRSLDNLRLRPRSPVEFVLGDAIANIPDDGTVVFFNNLFTGEPFHALLDAVIASVDRSPRKVIFLYGHPIATDTVRENPRFVRLDDIRSWRPNPEWAQECSIAVYEITPAAQ